MKISGIYAIINKIDGGFYIGQSVDIYHRLASHKSCGCPNSYVSKAINKHGWDNFHKITLEYININNYNIEDTKKILTEREDFWINYFDKLGYKKYNIRLAADSNVGIKHSECQRACQAKRMCGNKYRLGKKWSQEQKDARSLWMSGNSYAKGYKHSEETRAKNSKAQTGRKHTEESKAKMSLSQKGKKLSSEHVEKIRQNKTGMRASPETRRKISETLMGNKRCLGFKHTDKTIALRAASRIGKKHSEETKKKKQEGMLRRKLLDIKKVEI